MSGLNGYHRNKTGISDIQESSSSEVNIVGKRKHQIKLNN